LIILSPEAANFALTSTVPSISHLDVDAGVQSTLLLSLTTLEFCMLKCILARFPASNDASPVLLHIYGSDNLSVRADLVVETSVNLIEKLQVLLVERIQIFHADSPA